jgi:carbamoyl-phosphate synthase large subunit
MTKRIGVLLTSCGGLVIPGIVECLRAEKDWYFYIVGVDMQDQAVGAHFVDSFHTVPSGLEPAYPERILKVAQQENIDVIVPLSDEEVLALSQNRESFTEKGMAVLCSDMEAVATSSDKGKMLAFLQERGVPVPGFYQPASMVELDEAVELLGYPEQEIVLKPVRARGGRGFRILSEKVSGQDLVLKERYLQRFPYPALRPLLAEKPTLPPLMVMQYLSGRDFNVDALAWQGETLYCIPVERLVPEAGPVQVGRTVHDARIDAMVKQIVAAFGFSYNINVELAYPDDTDRGSPLIYEINPRVSAPIAMHRAAGVNLLLLGILLGMGRDIPRNLAYKDITMQRCWQEVYSE